MHIENTGPVFGLHFYKALVPQNPGIVDQNVHRPESIQGTLDNARTAFGRGHIIVIGHRLSSQGFNFVDNLIRRCLGAITGTVPGTAQIVDHDLGAAFGKLQGVGTAQPGAGTGDNGHTPVKANLCFGNLTIFKNAVVDHHFLGFGIDDFPNRLAFTGFPDDARNGHTWV